MGRAASSSVDVDEVLIGAEGIFASYGRRGGPPVDVLCDVTLSIRRGELVVLIGPNGAGKSTLLRVLSGILRPRAGVVRLSGSDLEGLSRIDVARRVAFVSQATEVAFGYQVHQVVMMGRSPHQRGLLFATADDVEATRAAMGRTGVADLAERTMNELSGGEQKLVALARAFAQRPEVLLLDEPSAHLDPRHSIELFELVVSEVRERGLACVAVAHDLNLAAAFADRVVLLDRGRVGAIGAVDEVMTRERLTQVFGLELEVEQTATGRCFVPRRRRVPDTRPSSGPDL